MELLYKVAHGQRQVCMINELVHMNLGETCAYVTKIGCAHEFGKNLCTWFKKWEHTRLREKFKHDIKKGCLQHNIK